MLRFLLDESLHKLPTGISTLRIRESCDNKILPNDSCNQAVLVVKSCAKFGALFTVYKWKCDYPARAKQKKNERNKYYCYIIITIIIIIKLPPWHSSPIKKTYVDKFIKCTKFIKCHLHVTFPSSFSKNSKKLEIIISKAKFFSENVERKVELRTLKEFSLYTNIVTNIAPELRESVSPLKS